MKKTVYSMIALAFLAVMFSSCGKDGNSIVPGGGNDGKHPELWHYDGKIKGLADIFPAIDEQGNIYFAGTEEGMAGGGFHFVSVDKNGKERWDKTIAATDASYVIYGDGKVFVATSDPVSIHVFDAGSGNEIWSKDYTADYDFEWLPSMAYANHKLYAATGQLTEGFLFALNPTDGAELWIRRLYDQSFFSIAVDGTKIYFGSEGEVSRYDDNGSSCDSIWHWKDGKSTSRGLSFFDMTIADDGNVYIRGDQSINILSAQTGEPVVTIPLDESFDHSTSGLVIDGNGNCYIGNGDLSKYSNSGELVWKSDITAGLVSPNYIQAPLIGENGKFYNGELFSLSCVNADGTLDWVLGTEAGVGNLHPVVMDNDGNLLSYSTEKGVLYCYKGDGSKLATKGWPKRYGTMGNTCSK